MFFRVVIFVISLQLASTQDANCDFYQRVSAGTTHYIYSPDYPNYYNGGLKCRWITDCPTGYRCRLNCPVVNLPSSPSCSLDRLLVSLTGDNHLNDAQVYCGKGSLNVRSNNTRISMGLITATNTTGGRFFCRLTAEAIPQPACRCGDRRSTRIVGGEETGVNEFPSMAALFNTKMEQITCGGIIISEWYVLTAAHCVVNESVDDYNVVVGAHDVKVDSPATRRYKISYFNSHPRYTESNFDYDIATVALKDPIMFNDRVGPVCMPFKFQNKNFARDKVTMLGWGTLFTGGPVSNRLQKVQVEVLAQMECLYKVSSLTDRQMCTYAPGKDACQFDSGGPVLYTDPSSGRLFSVGVISNGHFCASNKPGVNTRVTKLLSWIISNTPGANYCIV